eukprot:scaffold200891_cov27-Tisochrysis_lutea.AAC.1
MSGSLRAVLRTPLSSLLHRDCTRFHLPTASAPGMAVLTCHIHSGFYFPRIRILLWLHGLSRPEDDAVTSAPHWAHRQFLAEAPRLFCPSGSCHESVIFPSRCGPIVPADRV